MLLSAIFAFIVAYLLGNLNGAILISKLVSHDDIRSRGSGNAGFTNFFRNYGGISSLLVIVIDGLKAVVACLLGGWLLCPYTLEGMTLAAFAVTLGHDFPIFFGFHGGKGIMCGFLAALVIDWRIGLLILAVFLGCYLITSYVSLGSVLAAATFCIAFCLLHYDQPLVAIGGTLTAILAIFMHRENIKRLLRGEERKTYFFKRKDPK